ncbi:Cysteine proteinase inhibitor [Musa troglodytarum]|uniref:Cysteine proteinase inhibitor n=1 Tax=Musa troglodytarum TaxID=320322 RepID=A0A9E7KZ99_9LILI|nr:Cysteine proteinase inhibitor [Musa troglodytarum]
MSRLLAMLLLLLVSSSVSTSHAQSPGGWHPIPDLSDPHVREIAVFAVSKYNVQENKGLELSQVLAGQQQVVSGMNYNLTLLVKDGLSTAKCVAVVYESLKGEKELKSFVLIHEKVGGWTPVDVNNPHVHDITVFAVSEHNKEAKEHLTLVNVVKAQSQVVAGVNYKLLLVAKNEKGASGRYEAVVWEKEWENFRKLTSFNQLLNN